MKQKGETGIALGESVDKVVVEGVFTELECAESGTSKPFLTKAQVKSFLFYLLATLIVALGALWLVLYPFTSKIAGDWQRDSGTDSMNVSVEGDQLTLNVGNLSLPKDMQISFKGKVLGSGINVYRLTNINAYLRIDKTTFPVEKLEIIRKNQELYTVDAETADYLILHYSKKGLASLMDDQNSERYFKFYRETDGFLGKPILYLNNSRLAEERILFNKEPLD